jgi:hypothetical protein
MFISVLLSKLATLVKALLMKRIETSGRTTIAQSAERLATGWTTKGWEFKSRYGQEFSLLHIVQTGSGDHPAP